MTEIQRPLSPHLQVYRPQITSMVSIFHRITGFGLAVGTLLLAWWLVAAAYGPDAFAVVQGFIEHWFGRLCLLGFTFAFFYHLCNGIRHLFWDIGMGFEMTTVNRTGILVIVASLGLTLLTWIAGYAMRGGS